MSKQLIELRAMKKFSKKAWEERGLIPSSSALSKKLEKLLNECIDTQLQNLRDKKSKKYLSSSLRSCLESFDSWDLDTEEREFVADYFVQIAEYLGIDFMNEVDEWMYRCEIDDSSEQEPFDFQKLEQWLKKWREENKTIGVEEQKQIDRVKQLLLQGKELYEVYRETRMDIDQVGDIYAELVKEGKIVP